MVCDGGRYFAVCVSENRSGVVTLSGLRVTNWGVIVTLVVVRVTNWGRNVTLVVVRVTK